MDSDLADKYNDGIVPAPDLPEDVPPLRQAGSPAPSEPAGRRQGLVIAAVVAALFIGLCCLLVIAILVIQAIGAI
jgi:hypothetical protein